MWRTAPEILNGIAWSNALDEVFRSNYESDPTLGWQYFSSSIGFFRIFPGELLLNPVPLASNQKEYSTLANMKLLLNTLVPLAGSDQFRKRLEISLFVGLEIGPDLERLWF